MKDPLPDNGLEGWCREFCPTLPLRIECVVAEWDLRPLEKRQAVAVILEHVRQSVLMT
jgi:hypothetical protein